MSYFDRPPLELATAPSTPLRTNPTPIASIIWLHGLGADGHDFEALIPELRLPNEHSLRFIFPHAPYRPITLNNGYTMRGWYDIRTLTLSDESEEDSAGIRASEAALRQLIDNERSRGIPSQQILIAGFSQGGAIALHTALRYPDPLAGVLALSTYLPLATTLSSERHHANRATPIFLAHGELDEVILLEYALDSRDQLIAQGYPVQWNIYDGMGHTLCEQELGDIRHFLLQNLVSD